MAMKSGKSVGADAPQESPVDPNYAPETTFPSESEVGATEPMDHPLTSSPVDANYTDTSSAKGFPKDKSQGSSSFPSAGSDGQTESDDMAGVSGGGSSKYTDD